MRFAWQPAVLLACIALALLLLRRLSPRQRITLDGVCLLAISAWLAWRSQVPIFALDSNILPPDQVSLQLLAVAWWLLGARVAASLVRFFFGHDRRSREMRLFSDLAAAGIYLGAILAILSFVLDLPIRGLVATSGIIAVVIGLALQNTLADVFAGIAVGIEQPFRVGDRVRLADHVEGKVVQANWRSVRIQTDEDDIAIIPNSSVAKAEIINRSSPTRQRGAKVEVTCRATVPPQQVVQLLDQAVLLCPEILDTPHPRVALAGLGDTLNTYAISFAVADGHVAAVKSQLLQQVRRVFHHAGLLATPASPVAAAPPSASAVPPAALEPMQLLRELVILESLSDDQVEALSQGLQHRALATGDTLFTEGQADATLYIIAKGVLEIQRAAGTRGALGRIGPGEYIGEIGLLTGSPHTATARALTVASVYLLTGDAIAPLMANTEVAAALEASVRRGLDLAHRDSAARASCELGGVGHLLTRIRHFFQLPLAAPEIAPNRRAMERPVEHGEA